MDQCGSLMRLALAPGGKASFDRQQKIDIEKNSVVTRSLVDRVLDAALIKRRADAARRNFSPDLPHHPRAKRDAAALRFACRHGPEFCRLHAGSLPRARARAPDRFQTQNSYIIFSNPRFTT